MKVVSSHEYKEEALNPSPKETLFAPVAGDQKVKKQCAKTLRKVEAATGLTFDVVTQNDAGSDKMAACFDFTQNKAFISESTLAANDNGWAVYAGRHEKEHSLNRIKKFDVEKGLSLDHKQALQHALQEMDLTVDAMEGFNDLSTIKKHGKNRRSGYLKKEVPFAEKLEKLCQQETGKSLLETFRTGNAPLLNYQVRKLVDTLLCKQALTEHKKEHGSFFNRTRIKQVERQLKQEPPAVTSLKEARETIAKLFAEKSEIDTIRAKLAA